MILLQSCGGRKRAIAEKTDLTEMTLKTGRVLHILPDGGISGAPTLGGRLTWANIYIEPLDMRHNSYPHEPHILSDSSRVYLHVQLKSMRVLYWLVHTP